MMKMGGSHSICGIKVRNHVHVKYKLYSIQSDFHRHFIRPSASLVPNANHTSQDTTFIFHGNVSYSIWSTKNVSTDNNEFVLAECWYLLCKVQWFDVDLKYSDRFFHWKKIHEISRRLNVQLAHKERYSMTFHIQDVLVMHCVIIFQVTNHCNALQWML